MQKRKELERQFFSLKLTPQNLNFSATAHTFHEENFYC